MAVIMRFEVVRLQEGVTLPKAVVIIPCEARKNFSPSFLSYQDGLLHALKTRKRHFQTI